MYYPTYRYKSILEESETEEEADLPDIRVYCGICGKPIRIACDDLESVYSRSDYCQCHKHTRQQQRR